MSRGDDLDSGRAGEGSRILKGACPAAIGLLPHGRATDPRVVARRPRTDPHRADLTRTGLLYRDGRWTLSRIDRPPAANALGHVVPARAAATSRRRAGPDAADRSAMSARLAAVGYNEDLFGPVHHDANTR